MARASARKFFSRELEKFFRLKHLSVVSPTPDRVHDLRVCTRRLRAAFWLTGRRSIASRELKELGRKLGAKRELDVALEDAREYGLPLKPIRKRLGRAEAGLHRFFRSKKNRRLERDLLGAKAGEACQVDLPKSVARLVRQLSSWEAQPPRDREQLHAFRVFVKKARYAHEALGYEAEPLKDAQKALGEAHDLEVLRQLEGRDCAQLERDTRRAWRKARESTKGAIEFLSEASPLTGRHARSSSV